MIFTAITGALRNAFATSYPVAARWRAMHMLAYPAWCFALVHGLYAGRQAKPIFVILYSLCLVGVMGALALRAAPRPFKRKVATGSSPSSETAPRSDARIWRPAAPATRRPWRAPAAVPVAQAVVPVVPEAGAPRNPSWPLRSAWLPPPHPRTTLPRRRTASLKQVAKAVKRRGACSHPDGSAMFLESTVKAFTDDLAAHVLGNGCGRPVEGVLPLFEGGQLPAGLPGGQQEEESGPSRQKIYVDWTLCRGHGLCADILPEVFELGADGFPTVAQAQVPRYAEAKALRAVRRCPALALRIEEDTRSAPQARNNLPVLSQGRGRRALGR